MKKHTHYFIVASISLCLLLAVTSHAAESLSVRMQKAIFAEETEGDLDAAIKIYQNIVDEGEANRALVAKAHYRLGSCELKRGNKARAATSFRKIIERFSDQHEISVRAREQLGVLGTVVSSAAAVRQVWAGTPPAGDSVSPDGRFLAFVDWDSGNLSIRDLVSGDKRIITKEGSWELPQQFVDSHVFSADGKKIAHVWVIERSAELRLTNLENSETQIVIKRNPNLWITVEDWSSDGKFLAMLAYRNQGTNWVNQISIVSASDGLMRDIIPLEGRSGNTVRFSPDGRFLSYNSSNSAGGGQRSSKSTDIYVVDLETETEHLAVEHLGSEKFLDWAPRGSELLFTSDRRGSIDLWSLNINEGKTTGLPRLVQSNVGDMKPIGLTQNGALYYKPQIASNRDDDFYVALVNFDTGELVSAPQRLPTKSVEVKRPARLMADGSRLAYVTNDHGLKKSILHILDIESGQERDLENFPYAGFHHTPYWLPDKKRLLFRTRTGRPNGMGSALFLFDTETDAIIPISMATQENQEPYTPGLAFIENGVNGETVASFVQHDMERRKVVVVRKNLKTGTATIRDLLDLPRNGACRLMDVKDLKSDVQWISYIVEERSLTGERVWRLIHRNLQNHEEVELLRSKSPIDHRVGDPFRGVMVTTETGVSELHLFDYSANPPLNKFTVQLPSEASLYYWTPDGRHLPFVIVHGEGRNSTSELWVISADTGELSKTELSTPGVMGVQHVLGKPGDEPQKNGGERVYFRARNTPSNYREVWVMENFLPMAASVD